MEGGRWVKRRLGSSPEPGDLLGISTERSTSSGAATTRPLGRASASQTPTLAAVTRPPGHTEEVGRARLGCRVLTQRPGNEGGPRKAKSQTPGRGALAGCTLLLARSLSLSLTHTHTHTHTHVPLSGFLVYTDPSPLSTGEFTLPCSATTPQPLPIRAPSPVSHLDVSVSLPRWSFQVASRLAHPGGTQPLGGHPGRDCQARAGALIHFRSPVREESLAPISGHNQSRRGRPSRNPPGASHSNRQMSTNKLS